MWSQDIIYNTLIYK